MRYLLVVVGLWFTTGCTSLSTKRVPASDKALVETCESMLTPPSKLFSSVEPLEFEFAGEFDRVHKANAGGNWIGEDRTGAEYWTDSTILEVSQPERILKAKTRARGMSSADDVAFPKLRVEIEDFEDLKGTVFQGNRNFRMNTHVDTDPKTKFTEAGRLNNESSPYREATAYEIARVFDLAAPGIRRARVSYTDTGIHVSFTRNALLLESDKNIAERTGSIISKSFPDINNIPLEIGTRFHLFNVLIGNGDIGLKLKNESTMSTEIYRPMFNTTIFELPNGQQFPIVYDFDYSSFVIGYDGIFDTKGLPEFDIAEYTLEGTVRALTLLRSRLSQAEYQRMIDDYKKRKSAIENVIKSALIEEDGRVNAMAHVLNLDRAIAKLEKYPMLMKADVRFFADAKLTKDLVKPFSLSEKPGTLKPGVTVKVIEKKNDVTKIAIVDIRGMLVDYKTYIGYIKTSDLVLGFDLPENLQGAIDERDLAF